LMAPGLDRKKVLMKFIYGEKILDRDIS